MGKKVLRRVSNVTRTVRTNSDLLVRLAQPYIYLVEIPSILLPLILELVKPFMELPTWGFWVAFTEMVLSIRLLQEGTVARPLKRLVRVFFPSDVTPEMEPTLTTQPRRRLRSGKQSRQRKTALSRFVRLRRGSGVFSRHTGRRARA